MTAFFATFRRRDGRRRATGALLVAALWLKAAVLAVGLAQPVQASQSDVGAADRDLLTALRVICTSGGARVLGSSGGDGGADPQAAGMGLLDCARCCCASAHGAPTTTGAVLAGLFVLAAVPPAPRSVPPGETFAIPANPRAPPLAILI